MDTAPASPPCYAGLIPDQQAPADVTLWRRDQRAALIAARLARPGPDRERHAADLALALDDLIAPGPGMTLSLYWPFKAEPDLRPFMARAHERGARIALPVVVARGQPLLFREWAPGCAMERGVWNILQPADPAEVRPDVVIAPLVGFDPQGYRLGYGGGFFDRTLAALGPGVRAVGVGHPSAALRTIHPQPHDIPMRAIVTGRNRILRYDWPS